jgi:hypothetical protein
MSSGQEARGPASSMAPRTVVEACLHLGEKAGVVERQDRARPVRTFRPGDARAAARQRQDCERTSGQEMLDGAALMRPSRADGRNDADLRIAPAHDANARRLAQPRFASVRGDQQRSAQRSVTGEIDGDLMLVCRKAFRSRAGQERDGRPGGSRGEESFAQAPMLDDVGGGLAAHHGVVVGDQHRDGRHPASSSR